MQPLLLRSKIAISKSQILCSIEIEAFLLGMLHSQVVTTHLYLVKLIGIYEHLSLRLSQKALHILGLHLVDYILVLGSHRLLRSKVMDCSSQSESGVHQQLVPHYSIYVDLYIFNIYLAIGKSIYFALGSAL